MIQCYLTGYFKIQKHCTKEGGEMTNYPTIPTRTWKNHRWFRRIPFKTPGQFTRLFLYHFESCYCMKSTVTVWRFYSVLQGEQCFNEHSCRVSPFNSSFSDKTYWILKYIYSHPTNTLQVQQNKKQPYWAFISLLASSPGTAGGTGVGKGRGEPLFRPTVGAPRESQLAG